MKDFFLKIYENPNFIPLATAFCSSVLAVVLAKFYERSIKRVETSNAFDIAKLQDGAALRQELWMRIVSLEHMVKSRDDEIDKLQKESVHIQAQNEKLLLKLHRLQVDHFKLMQQLNIPIPDDIIKSLEEDKHDMDLGDKGGEVV